MVTTRSQTRSNQQCTDVNRVHRRVFCSISRVNCQEPGTYEVNQRFVTPGPTFFRFKGVHYFPKQLLWRLLEENVAERKDARAVFAECTKSQPPLIVRETGEQFYPLDVKRLNFRFKRIRDSNGKVVRNGYVYPYIIEA
jgi:uncharacterized protein (DUF1684 family)